MQIDQMIEKYLTIPHYKPYDQSVAGGARKRRYGVDEATRHQLALRARHARTRTSAFSRARPTDWRPGEVRNPDGDFDTHFTDESAWDFIATRLERGQEVEVIALRKPMGAKGYVMKIDLGSELPELYVKLQMGASKIIGRSFHCSEPNRGD